jgi:H+-transporting ATPase
MESKTDKPEPKDDKDSLKTLAMPELMKKLGASADGLTQAEATKRQAQYGPNQIEEKKTNEYLKFLSYFWGPIPWMIEAAVILSGIGHCRPQSPFSGQGQGQARWQVGGS